MRALGALHHVVVFVLLQLLLPACRGQNRFDDCSDTLDGVTCAALDDMLAALNIPYAMTHSDEHYNDPCSSSFVGCSCDYNLSPPCFVTSVTLTNLILSGTIPSSLASLSSLSALTLRNINTQGTVPASLASLSASLQTLDLSHNALTGALPLWLGNMTSLSVLKLSYNKFAGSIPSELGNIIQTWGLQLADSSNAPYVMDLSYNQLNGTLPASFDPYPALAVSLAVSKRASNGTLLNTSFFESTDAWIFPDENDFLKGEYIDTSFTTTSTTEPPMDAKHALGADLGFGYPLYNDFVLPNRPQTIGNVRMQLNVAFNALSGDIPAWLAYYGAISISSNAFTGQVPSTLLHTCVPELSSNGAPFGAAFDLKCGSAPDAATGRRMYWLSRLPARLPDIVSPSPINSCTPGQFMQTVDMTVNGSLTYPSSVCAPCAPGTYSNTVSASACSACPVGQQSTNNFTACAQCPAGTFLNASAQYTCQQCAPGFSASSPGSIACSLCPPGWHSSPDFTSCLQCPVGTALNSTTQTCDACIAGTYSAAGASICTQCAAGTYSGAAATTCTPCAAGTYLAGNGSCVACAQGQYAPSPSSTTCLVNPLGAYSSADRTSYTSCAAGTFLDANWSCQTCAPGSISATGAVACAPCAPGSFSSPDFTTCTPCPAGKYLASSGTCQLCSAGTYAPSPSSTSCLLVPAGSYASADRTTYTSCAAGAFVNTTAQTCQRCAVGSISGANAVSCTPCASGFTSDASFTTCVGCAAGQFLNASSFCNACPPMTFSSAGAITCTACPSGSQANSNATGCVACPAGTYLTGNGSCLSCVAGTYAPTASSTSCSLCTPGSYSNPQRTACTACSAGTFLNASSQLCQPCSPGSYSPTAGAVACTVNPPGFASSTQTTFASNVTLTGVNAANFGASQNATLTASLAATLGVPASAITITSVASTAPAGRHLLQSSAAVAFSVATSNGTQASSLRSALNATAAFAGALATSLRSSADPVLSSVASVAATAPAETALVLASLPCPIGTFLNGLTQQCDQCAVGLVTTSTGSITCSKCPSHFAWASSSQCVSCPSNSVTSPNDAAQCACDFGYYDSLFGASLTEPVCLPCPLGGVCTSGFVGAAAGFWRETTWSDIFYQCRVGNCVEETVVGPLNRPAPANSTVARRALLQLSLNASVPTNCVHGNTGPLCALCLPGYSLQSGVCGPCDPKDAFENWSSGSQAGLLIGCAIVGVITLAFGLFQPISPALESAAAAAIAGGHSLKLALVACATFCMTCHSRATTGDADNDAANNADDTPEATDAITATDVNDDGYLSFMAEAKNKVSEAENTRNAAVSYVQGASLAYAVGTGVMNADDGDASSVHGSDAGAIDAALAFQDKLQELMEKLAKYTKIIVNFYQIVSTFLKSLDIPWPHIFGSVMARVSVVNLNLVQLPKTACLNPSPSFYKQFNGYTLGLVFAVLGMCSLYLLGVKVVSRISLRGMSEEERLSRVSQFSSTLLSRALLVLYIAYPGVSVVIFSVFSCTTLESGVAYLDADASIVCYDKQHWKYVGVAIVWLLVVPIGVPAFFIWLLRRFKVPQMAALVNDSAWVREAVQLAWQMRMAQPACDVAKLNVDSITDAHLEGLYALFVRKSSAVVAGHIALGEAPPLPDEEEPEVPPPVGFVAETKAKLQAAAARAAAAQQRAKLLASAARHAGAPDESPQALRRAFVLEALLTWCKTAGKLALPPMAWDALEIDEVDEADEKPAGKKQLKQEAYPAAAYSDTVRYDDLPRLRFYAMRDVGFLFAAYHTQTWYWEVVELMRKLALTSILGLIAPGSAGQVVVGLLLAFVALMANMRLKPYADRGLNFVSQTSQLNLFFFLFVALLLKVNLDGQGDAHFFAFIVGILSIVPIALPIIIKLWIQLYGGGTAAKMITKDATWT